MEQNNTNRFNWRCGDKKWYKKRWLVLGLLVVAVIALVIARCLQIKSSHLTSDDDGKYQGNESRAARMIAGMDRNVDPCEDFHKFACSGWRSRDPMFEYTMWQLIEEGIVQKYKILLEEPDQDNDLHPMKLARVVYKMCKDTANRADKLELTPIFEMLSKLGLSRQPPSLNDTGIDLDPSQLVGLVRRYLNLDIFIEFFIYGHVHDPSKNHMVIGQDKSLVLSPRELIDPEESKFKLPGFKRLIKEILQLAGLTAENSRLFADEIIEFKTKLAKIMVKSEKIEELEETYLDLTVGELQNFTDPTASIWNWTKYFEAVFENTDVILETNVDRVIVGNLEYLQKLSSLLSVTSRATIVQYIWWEAYYLLAHRTIQKTKDLLAEFNEQFYGLKKFSKARHCIFTVEYFFEWPLKDAYTKRYIDEPASNVKVIHDILLNFRIAFEEMISKSGWMDKETHARVHNILYAMRETIQFPQWATDYEFMNHVYEGFEIIPGDYARTYLKLLDVWTMKKFNSLRINSTILPQLSIVFATLLQAGIYEEGSESINYGALGAWIGPDIIYHFDDQWCQYYKYHYGGQSRSHTLHKTLHYDDEKVKCLIKHYSSYSGPEWGDNFTIAGNLTLIDNIADNEGIRVAYRAYQKLKLRGLKEQALPGLSNYTQDQLFFLSYAQSLCKYMNYNDEVTTFELSINPPPNRLRVIATLSNNEEFSKAWNCSIGSRMNPPHKCTFW